MDKAYCKECGVSFQEVRIASDSGNVEVFNAIRNEWTEQCPQCDCTTFVDSEGYIWEENEDEE